MIPPPRPRRIGSAGARSKPALSRARAEIRALRAEVELLRAVSTTDLLTGLLNYRGFHERLADEPARCRRAGLPLSVVAIDFDKLKQVNDSLGHRVGDEVLKILAREISYGARPSDICGRVGGDEFVIALAGVPEADAHHVVDRVRAAAGLTVPGIGRLGFSAGIATMSADGGASTCADVAMDEAKRRHHNDARSDRIVALRHSSEQAIVDSQRLVNSAIELQRQTRSGRTRRERTLRERTVSKRHRP
jgi:diguanylate cyclase (GGDEF)-like protein